LCSKDIEEVRVRTRLRLLAIAFCAWGMASSPAFTQGVQTSILQGTVRDSGGLVLPGVTVTVTSPALQGPRSTVTDSNGVYILRGLPPGQYTLAFELGGFARAQEQTTIELGRTTSIDASLQLATVTEQVTVTAETPSALATTSGGMNFTYEEVDALPTQRTLSDIAELAPGLVGEANTPNNDQIQVAGSFAYDNVFLIDGVDVNDNLFGTANNLFIEDAIEETQVLTSGVSAEFGRFSGGVVNAITKSGSNQFEGSFRVNLTNDAWTAETPFEIDEDIERPDIINDEYEGTFGGPILRDRLWFFTAARWSETTDPNPFPQTGLPVTRTNENRRWELKLTGTAWQNHTFQGSYFTSPTDQSRPSFDFSIDPATIVDRELPNTRFVANWRGVLGSRVFATAQYSQKDFGFRGTGGTDTNILESPFITLTQDLGHYNAPYFDSTDPEDRNNQQIAASVSYFLTTERLGSHDFKTGFENFRSRRTGGNSQSATNYVFDADYLTDAAGNPVFDANNRLVPLFVPGETLIENWLATRGALIDISTRSWYAQDTWTATDRLTFDLGVRFEDVVSEATGDITTVDTSTWMPRLGATLDATGDGRWVLQTTYGHYSGKYSEAQFAENTNVGNPTLLLGVYNGPAGQGRSFAPGFDPANYEIVTGNFPTANVFVDEGLSSPTTREFTASAGTDFNDGYFKATYQWRRMEDFVEDFITLDTGQTTVSQAGVTRNFQNRIFRNSDEPERRYQAMLLQGRYQLMPSWSLNGHWTVQLENEGNFEGEGTNTPGISSVIGDYPEVRDAERHYPVGRFDDFQRHRARFWTIVSPDFGRMGRPDFSVMYRYDSPRAFSLAATGVPLTPEQTAALVAYASRPSSQILYFEGRGTGEFEAAHVFDAAFNYRIPIWRNLGPWFKFEVINVFNSQPLIGFNTAVTPDPASPRDALGLPTGFVEGPRFGEAEEVEDFPLARTFRMAFGFRF
jgi:hypothetical protein